MSRPLAIVLTAITIIIKYILIVAFSLLMLFALIQLTLFLKDEVKEINKKLERYNYEQTLENQNRN